VLEVEHPVFELDAESGQRSFSRRNA